MYPAPRICPVCHETLYATRLHCRNCETTLDGSFMFSGLFQLEAEQLNFVETFIRCEGKFNRMEKEMGLSYPTLRTRLHEIIRALGYPVGGEEENILSQNERNRVLDDLSSGNISVEDAVVLFNE